MSQHWKYLGALALALSSSCNADLADGNPCHAIIHAQCDKATSCSQPSASSCYSRLQGFESNCKASASAARSCAADLDNQACGDTTLPASCSAAMSDFFSAASYNGTTGGSRGSGGSYSSGGIGGAHSTGGIGGTHTTGGSSAKPTTTSTCSATIPTSSGNMTVSSDYVTEGSLHGFAFTYRGSTSNSTTCITPSCNDSGCTPQFKNGSAICAAGTVTKDTTLNSSAGVGFYINQNQSDSSIRYVTIPSSVTIATYSGSGAGNAYMRANVHDTSGNDYCVDVGNWMPSTPIPITRFNTACSGNSGSYASAATQVEQVMVYVSASSAVDRPFDFCLTSVTIQ